MGGILAGGVEVFTGVTGSGKTTKAKARQAEECVRWKVPALTLDLEHAADWQDVHHATGLPQVLDCLYVKRISPPPYTPIDRDRLILWNAVAHWGGVSIIVDGLPMIADAHNLEEEFRQAMYRHRHGRLRLPVFYFLVAQRSSLIHRHVFAACQTVWVFRQAPGVDADRIYHEFGVPPSVSTRLERGKYAEIPLGFRNEGAAPSRGAASAGQSPASGGEPRGKSGPV